ncbi:MAG: hypothetical protein KAI47_18980, partial [Deltaproteobacteria bacterium]|nr:hypothetical protein [Deltaproteobacteria bacterium]
TVDGVVDAIYGAAIATDKAGDAQGTGILDLRSLHLYADASQLYVAITINGDIVATNWGKYVLYIDTTNDTKGATTDAWGRKVTVSDPHKPEFSINAWVNEVPFGPQKVQLWAWNATAWAKASGVGITAAAIKVNNGTSVLEYAVPRAILGGATTIWVEAFSTGGDGSNAQDTLNVPAEDWNATDWATTAALSVSTPFSLATPTPDAGVADVGVVTQDVGVVTPDVGGVTPDVGVVKDVSLLPDSHGDLNPLADAAHPHEMSTRDVGLETGADDLGPLLDSGSSRHDGSQPGPDSASPLPKPTDASEGCHVASSALTPTAFVIFALFLVGLLRRRRS